MGADGSSEGTSAPNTRIFLSYRRDDSGDVTGRIYDRLVKHFGADQIVRDVDDIPLGVDFVDYIEDKLSDCRWCLAIIGDRWASIENEESGGPRIMQPNDNVRLELEVAFERKLLLVPVLVRGARPPKAEELPESLHKLPRRNGQKVRRDPDFNRDMEKLVASLAQHTPLLKGQSTPEVSAPPAPTQPTPPPTDGPRPSG